MVLLLTLPLLVLVHILKRIPESEIQSETYLGRRQGSRPGTSHVHIRGAALQSQPLSWMLNFRPLALTYYSCHLPSRCRRCCPSPSLGDEFCVADQLHVVNVVGWTTNVAQRANIRGIGAAIMVKLTRDTHEAVAVPSQNDISETWFPHPQSDSLIWLSLIPSLPRVYLRLGHSDLTF